MQIPELWEPKLCEAICGVNHAVVYLDQLFIYSYDELEQAFIVDLGRTEGEKERGLAQQLDLFLCAQ